MVLVVRKVMQHTSHQRQGLQSLLKKRARGVPFARCSREESLVPRSGPRSESVFQWKNAEDNFELQGQLSRVFGSKLKQLLFIPAP